MTFSAVSQIAERIAGTLCLLALGGSAVYITRDLHVTQVRARTSIEQLTQGMTSALNFVNRPCGSGGPCGLLAEANKTMVKVQDISVTTQRQVSQSAVLVNSASAAIQSAAGDVHSVASHASDLTVQATTDLRTANETISAGKPLLDSLTRTSDASALAVQHFDALVQSKDWLEALHHVNGMTASGDAILADGRRVSDKLTDDYLAPKPWYSKVWKYTGDTYDVAAFFARHAN